MTTLLIAPSVDAEVNESNMVDALDRFGKILSHQLKTLNAIEVVFEDERDADDARREMQSLGHFVLATKNKTETLESRSRSRSRAGSGSKSAATSPPPARSRSPGRSSRRTRRDSDPDDRIVLYYGSTRVEIDRPEAIRLTRH
jgi:hypothetical protein